MKALNNINDLKDLIFDLSFEASNLLEEYQYELNILLEVKEDLNNNKLSRIVRKYFFDKYRINVENKDIIKYKVIIENDIYIIQKQIVITKNREKNLTKTYKILKSYEIINEETINYIKKELICLGYDNKTIITMMEKISINNALNSKKSKDYKHSDFIHELINMLYSGYEYIPLDKDINSNKDRLNNEVKHVINLLKENSFKVVKDNMVLEKYYNFKELKYIYAKLLRYYQKAMMDNVNLMVDDRDFYFDKELLLTLKIEYFDALKKYKFIRNLYDNLVNKDYDIDDAIEDLFEEEYDINKLYYSSNSSEPNKCYFVKDLMDIREEALDTIQNLINNFKEGYMNNTKKLTTGALELRYDQIRIILRRIKGNCYSVLGVFIKKSYNMHDLYTMIVNRKDAVIDDEYSREVEEFYNNYINMNSRKGSR